MQLARIFYSEGNKEEARLALEQALRIDPGHAEASEAMANLKF